MLIRPLLDELLPKVDTRYTLAMLVAKRTRQLVDSAQPMVKEETPNLVTLACEEIAQGKVLCIQGIHQPVIPIRPEVEEARRLAAELAANAELEALREANDLIMESSQEAIEDAVGNLFQLDDTFLEDAETEDSEESGDPEDMPEDDEDSDEREESDEEDPEDMPEDDESFSSWEESDEMSQGDEFPVDENEDAEE